MPPQAYRSLVAKGTITPTCNTSWSGMIGQIAESVSKVHIAKHYITAILVALACPFSCFDNLERSVP